LLVKPDMRIDIRGNGERAVTKNFHDQVKIYIHSSEQGRRTVPQVMKPNAPNTRSATQLGKRTVKVTRLDRGAELCREH